MKMKLKQKKKFKVVLSDKERMLIRTVFILSKKTLIVGSREDAILHQGIIDGLTVNEKDIEEKPLSHGMGDTPEMLKPQCG